MGEELGVDPAALHRSIARLREANLVDDERRVNKRNSEEFLIHAVPYVVPGRLGAATRGVPTAWGVEPLRRLMGPIDEVPVWPDPEGERRGPALEPVAAAAPQVAEADPELGRWLALLDAIRIGRARERKLAAAELSDRIWSGRE